MEPGVVIVGAGTAAGELAAKLRQAGYAGAVTLVGAEAHLPYHRPPLSKLFLAGEVDEDSLLLRPASTYDKLDIGFRGNIRVTRIDRAAKAVTLADGSTLPYRWLVLATGGQARTLTCPGAELAGVFTLRGIADSRAIRGAMAPGRRLVIIGGGYIGLEVAAIAIKRGLAVTVIEAAPRVLARVAGAEISAFYEQAHRDAGVTILTGQSVTALTPRADPPAGADTTRPRHVGAVTLADGTAIPADLVIAGIGLIPHTELAEAAGLQVQNGIWVDEYCRTDDPAILAIGDCANHPCPFLGRRVRLESVPNAIEQSRVAADTIVGKLNPYTAVPWFWSDQYDLKLQAVGLIDGHDQVVLRGTYESRAFLLFYLRAGRLIAADAVNKPGEFLVARRLVGAAINVDPARLADITIPLKNSLPQAA
jgi:3-phenylpropionate/trans-cinnamate dioxygenase ferredoxin reductase subunit